MSIIRAILTQADNVRYAERLPSSTVITAVVPAAHRGPMLRELMTDFCHDVPEATEEALRDLLMSNRVQLQFGPEFPAFDLEEPT